MVTDTVVEEKDTDVNPLVSAIIGTVLGAVVLGMLQKLIGIRDARNTSAAIVSPKGKVYFFPHPQACRIVRKQNWSFASLTTLTRMNCLKSALRGSKVYKFSAPWDV